MALGNQIDPDFKNKFNFSSDKNLRRYLLFGFDVLYAFQLLIETLLSSYLKPITKYFSPLSCGF